MDETQDPEPAPVAPTKPPIVSCLAFLLLLGVGAGAAGYALLRASQPARAPNGAAILSHPELGRVLAVGVSKGQLLVVEKFSGRLWRETAGGQLEYYGAQAPGRYKIGSTLIGSHYVPLASGNQVLVLDSTSGLTQPLADGADAYMTRATASEELVATSSRRDSVIRVFRISDGALLWKETKRQRGGGGRVAFNEDLLAVGAQDGKVLLYEAATGELVWTLSRDGGPIRALCFSPDGSHLAAATADETVAIWLTGAEGPPSLEFKAGDGLGLTAIAFSEDGEFLATGNEIGLLEVWDPTGRLLFSLPHDNEALFERTRHDPTRVGSIVFNDKDVIWSVYDRVYTFDVTKPPQ
ncbi:MAG: PQQ-binding-like beta-propeller repeat protein [Planctomycetes bacterium]|nr:PQQ-binding-like beta-propeller repeat protein [Planctomycetota bacterium]